MAGARVLRARGILFQIPNPNIPKSQCPIIPIFPIHCRDEPGLGSPGPGEFPNPNIPNIPVSRDEPWPWPGSAGPGSEGAGPGSGPGPQRDGQIRPQRRRRFLRRGHGGETQKSCPKSCPKSPWQCQNPAPNPASNPPWQPQKSCPKFLLPAPKILPQIPPASPKNPAQRAKNHRGLSQNPHRSH